MRLSRWLFAFVVLVFTGVAAQAHPHVWVTSASELIYAPDGSVTGVRHAWTFDDMFSTYAVQGLPSQTKGVYTRDELKDLAQTNVDSLKDFAYFTHAKIGAKKEKFGDPTDYYLDYTNNALTLHFTLPLKTPAKAPDVVLEIYDASYFVNFVLAEKDPIKLVGAPAACKTSVQKPSDGKAQQQTLSEQSFLDGSNANFGVNFANRITVACP